MSPRIYNFDRERWLKLARQALDATVAHEPDGDALAKAAGRMATATPPSSEPFAMATCLAFRWGCIAFAHASAVERGALTPSVTVLAHAVLRLFGDAPTPPEAAAAAAAAPAPPITPDVPAWSRRADIGG